jgi:hypothetical protein
MSGTAVKQLNEDRLTLTILSIMAVAGDILAGDGSEQ